MTAAEIRERFLNFFEQKGHMRVKSSSLVPQNDPTLFFTNAGMVQFKEYFLGELKSPSPRACSSQKCMRVSGKHNDLENVGKTPRHHTFFEMLGNFSFGDYFKKEAIAYAWEFLTKDLGLNPKQMYVTVFREDDEAEELWKQHVPADHIFRLDEKDNFWSMGDTGPCGPCSEIMWDFEPGSGEVTKETLETTRFMEIWNLVFMQFDQRADGTRHQLAAPSIDTGMGLERLACVLQGKRSNWETDVFLPLITEIEKITKHKEAERSEVHVALRVIADHLRASCFLISDGVTPSNEGRGYVLRRIMRRAIRFGKSLDQHEPFLVHLVPKLVSEMSPAYPELKNNEAFIEKVIRAEEERFFETLERGLALLEEAFAQLKAAHKTELAGETIFKLYDTFGFPKDLTELIAAEKGFTLDDAGFDVCMEEQKKMARASWKGSGEEKVGHVWQQVFSEGLNSTFVGYKETKCVGRINAIVMDGEKREKAQKGDIVFFTTDKTPFYAESGGQVGDTGTASSAKVKLTILDTQKPVPGLHVHKAKVLEGELFFGDELQLQVDEVRRKKIAANHTATHLLHKALRETLGEHVKQAGSHVNEDRLRFDFSHFQALSKDDWKKIQELANNAIKNNIKVETNELPYDEAIAKGALAFFGEKYGDIVRLVEVGDFSKELCGGTHTSSTGEIKLVSIESESSVAAGVRRIEAATADLAYQHKEKEERTLLEEIAKKMEALLSSGGKPSSPKPHLEALVSTLTFSDPALFLVEYSKRKNELLDFSFSLDAQLKQLDKQQSHKKLEQLKTELEAKALKDFGDVQLLSCSLGELGSKELRELASMSLNIPENTVLVLGSYDEGKVSLVAKVPQSLQNRIKAGDIIKHITPIVDGKGGGKADFAQGGGTNVSALQQALEKVEELLK
ncbi:MAG: alanine--tRNA ligase [Deltaproteobacteria bacterium CG_4_10_14_0_2_um_filter_43_8]|nr:MAG: alanine--tRNA ligase [Deltaproteobacteria bacterium CG_4_10_14_0_2_um_filter_43_8]